MKNMSTIQGMLALKAIAVVSLVGFAAAEAGSSLSQARAEAQAMRSEQTLIQPDGGDYYSLIHVTVTPDGNSEPMEYVEDDNMDIVDCLERMWAPENAERSMACTLQPDGKI